MTTPEKCEAILRKLVATVNEHADEDPTGLVVSFGPDWGGNALTIDVKGSHTHVGDSSGTFEQLIDSLHDLLIEGRGLSWAGGTAKDGAS